MFSLATDFKNYSEFTPHQRHERELDTMLKQLVAYVGRDAFLEGARRYFKRNAYGNTKLGDLLSVLEETSGRDMASWSRAWLQTAGVNSLTPQVLLDPEGRIDELAVVRFRGGLVQSIRYGRTPE